MSTSLLPHDRPAEPGANAAGTLEDQEQVELTRILADCVRALFATYGVSAQLAPLGPPDAPSNHPLALVGFAGEQVRGALVFNASNGMLAHSYPMKGVVLGDDELSDWSGELANLLLGRIKRELILRGVVIQLGTPTVVSGSFLKARDSARPLRRVLCRFEAEGFWAKVRLDLATSSGFRLLPPSPTSNAAPEPGVVDGFLFDD